MIAAPTFRETLLRAKREARTIECVVLMADDSVRMVIFGPRGGWKFSV